MKHPFLARAAALSLTLAMAVSMAACGAADPADTTSSEPITVPVTVQTEPTTLPPAAPTESAVDPSLLRLRQDLEPSGAIAAVFYLGYHEGALTEPDFELLLQSPQIQSRYPFLRSVSREQGAFAPGGEIYCLVPADPDADVQVSLWDESEGPGSALELLYESGDGAPFFLQGNISDIMPNLSVTIRDSMGAELTEYHPYLSLRDGKVASSPADQPLVMDLTDYGSGDGPITFGFELNIPNEAGDGFDTIWSETAALDPEFVLGLLIEQRVFSESVAVQSFREADSALYLDLSSTVLEDLSGKTDSQEALMLGALANSFLSAFGADRLILTADGLPIQTENALYDQPLTYSQFIG